LSAFFDRPWLHRLNIPVSQKLKKQLKKRKDLQEIQMVKVTMKEKDGAVKTTVLHPQYRV
jgi:hypothetical protein